MQIHLVNPRRSVFGLIYKDCLFWSKCSSIIFSFCFFLSVKSLVQFLLLYVLADMLLIGLYSTLLSWYCHFKPSIQPSDRIGNYEIFVVVGKISIIFNIYPLLYAIFPRLQVLTKSNLIFLLSMLHNTYLYFFIDR